MAKLSPRQNTLAYLVWCKAQAAGWALTTTDLVDYINTDTRHRTSKVEIAKLAAAFGWTNRLSGKTIDRSVRGTSSFMGDTILHGESASDIVQRHVRPTRDE
jgi:hypothetical protein